MNETIKYDIIKPTNKFTGIDFLKESVPDETTLCKFRHLLEVNGLNKLFFEAINRVMVQSGHMIKGGTIVDATIIDAPSSTKNVEKARDPDLPANHAASGCFSLPERETPARYSVPHCF